MVNTTEPFSMFLSLFPCLCLAATVSAYCNVSIAYNGDLKEPQPLILTENGNDFFYPNTGTPKLMLQRGESVLIACPGNQNKITNTNLKEAKATCESGKNFIVNNEIRSFSSITCKMNVVSSTKDLQPCLGNHKSIAIGFQLDTKFLLTIQVCRDANTYVTYYTKFKLIGRDKQYNNLRPSFQPGEYFNGMNVDRLYYRGTQRSAIKGILNIDPMMAMGDELLTRGHLAAKGDFVYGSQQNATFHYLNSAPQWGGFNSGNWNALELSIRKFTKSNNFLDLEVYTGVHGQMTMSDIRQKQQVITIRYPYSKPLLVPRFFWKVIYHRSTKRGTAFVGLNDPFIPHALPDVYLCNKIDRRITWLEWMPQNITAGLSYACTVDDLRSRIPTIPRLDVVDILT
ncbi:salivary endonuclease-like [Lasioglossum baleicum]|uniref:salivary endonuclease-like n=1 Tax=Lasioglossum baleicum TaxID=434251 RepID=UPI003FCEC0D8